MTKGLKRQLSKSFTVVIQRLSTRLIKPNFCSHLSDPSSTTVSLETRNPFYHATCLFQFPAHKTILSCLFSDILAWDKIPPFLSNLPSDVLHSLLHYCYNCSLPSNISEDTAKELLRISQQHSNSFGNLGELCMEFLDATAVKNSEYDDCLMSVFYKPSSIMLQFIKTVQDKFCLAQ